jgi:hypothetical protein
MEEHYPLQAAESEVWGGQSAERKGRRLISCPEQQSFIVKTDCSSHKEFLTVDKKLLPYLQICGFQSVPIIRLLLKRKRKLLYTLQKHINVHMYRRPTLPQKRKELAEVKYLS